MTKLVAAVCLATVAMLSGCGRSGRPNSMFDAPGYHVSGDTVYYLNAFPGNAFEIDGADAASFHGFDTTYARDTSNYVNGRRLPHADAASFVLLDRPGYAKDRFHVFALDRPISDDPAQFELLDGDLAKDSTAVYWSDGSVLSDDPAHFAIISNIEHYLFAEDSRTVRVNGTPVVDADPSTFQVLGGAYARDENRGFYFTDRVADLDVATFHAHDGPYAADAKRVCWMGKTIPGPIRAASAC